MTTDNNTPSGDVVLHRFEKAGLGRAPYKLVEFGRRAYCAAPGAPVQPGASCDYCGTAIFETFVLESADGKKFKVGNDCIRRAGDAGLMNVTKRILNKARTEARHQREEERISAAKQAMTIPGVITALKLTPHPYQWARDAGKTGFDFVVWMMTNAGNKGKIAAAKMVERAAKGEGK